MSDYFSERPWMTSGASVEGMPPGMLSGEEGCLLHWLAKNYFSGAGDIIDAGAFLGSSSFCLAKGLEDNPRIVAKSGRVHAYDLFEVWREQGTTWQFMAGELKRIFNIDVEDNQSTLPIYIANVGSLAKHIRVNPGDIVQKVWSGRPIEILFIDICKSIQLWKHVLKIFYPSLIPGRAIVLHQDYHHPLLPFIHVAQERFSDYFDIVEEKVTDTTAFLLRDRIPDNIFAEVMNYDFSPSQELKLMDSAIERLHNNNRHLFLAKVQLLRQRGFLKEARTLLEELKDLAPTVVGDPRFTSYIGFVEPNLLRDEAATAPVPEEFNEKCYLRANPDVQEAVNLGVMESGFHHWYQYGEKEGRPWA